MPCVRKSSFCGIDRLNGSAACIPQPMNSDAFCHPFRATGHRAQIRANPGPPFAVSSDSDFFSIFIRRFKW